MKPLDRYNAARESHKLSTDKATKAYYATIMRESWQDHLASLPKRVKIKLTPIQERKAWFKDREKFGPTTLVRGLVNPGDVRPVINPWRPT